LFPDFDYIKPSKLNEALAALREAGEDARLLAGGTALLVDLRHEHQCPRLLVDIGELDALRFIRADAGAVRIGAATTLTEIIESPLIGEVAPLLAAAAASVGGPLVRNRATIAGNLTYASPGADMAPPLLALGATLKLMSDREEREVPIDEFFVGPRRTICRRDEIVTEMRFPVSGSGKGAFVKLGLRNAMAIALASVGVWIEWDGRDGVIREARVALGAVGPTPARVKPVEDMLCGAQASTALVERAAEATRQLVQPRTSSIRSSGEYRRTVASALLRKAMEQVLNLRLGEE